MAKGIEYSQIKKIYAIANALGLCNREKDDYLHLLVAGLTGKDSIKKLTYNQANDIISELQKRQDSYTPKNKGEGSKISGGITKGQIRKIWALMYSLEKLSPSEAGLGDRLCGVIEKNLYVTAIAKDPFRFIDHKGGNKLIEVLKGYIKTIERKAGDSK